MENGIRHSDGSNGNDITVLQRLRGTTRSGVVLSIDGLFSNRDVHCKEKNTQVFIQMDWA